nr:splicing factor U2af large subunit A-like isoform X1 [Ipomoea batatas]
MDPSESDAAQLAATQLSGENDVAGFDDGENGSRKRRHRDRDESRRHRSKSYDRDREERLSHRSHSRGRSGHRSKSRSPSPTQDVLYRSDSRDCTNHSWNISKHVDFGSWTGIQQLSKL